MCDLGNYEKWRHGNGESTLPKIYTNLLIATITRSNPLNSMSTAQLFVYFVEVSVVLVGMVEI